MVLVGQDFDVNEVAGALVGGHYLPDPPRLLEGDVAVDGDDDGLSGHHLRLEDLSEVTYTGGSAAMAGGGEAEARGWFGERQDRSARLVWGSNFEALWGNGWLSAGGDIYLASTGISGERGTKVSSFCGV